MSDWWKLKREAVRFGQQLRALPEALWEPVAQARHDRAFAAGFPTTSGAVPVGPNVAILLIYQPDTLAPSVLHLCKHLHDKGFATQIVSNGTLPVSSKTALQPHVWKILERPNFGYDFGGYRDGLRALDVTPERLLILNDSIWYPVWDNDTLLDDLAALNADIAGTNLRVRGAERFLESYCYLIRGAVLKHAAFWAYWNTLKITSNKYKVIRRGERGFSRAMLAAGLDVRGLYEPDVFLADLAKQSDDFLRKTLTYAAHTHSADAARGADLLARANDPTWRADVLAHIKASLIKGQIYSCFPYASVKLQHYAVLKKSGDRVSQGWRDALLRAIDAGDLASPEGPVLKELRQMQTSPVHAQ